MKIYTPLAPDIVHNQNVIDSLKNQTYKHIEIIPIIAGVNCQPIKNDWPRWMDNIMLARNACLSAMVDQDFGVINDNDCIHTHPDNLQLMMDALMQDRELVCVALRKNDQKRPDHISVGCMMFRFAFHRLNIKFHYSITMCECTALTMDIRNAGFKIEYVDETIRINNLSHQNYKVV
jgi:hypothetical protein